VAGLTRRVETFVAGYFGRMDESTAFTTLAMQDLDSPALKQNFALTDRTKQYLDMTTPVTVTNTTTVDPTTYSLQRLGAIVRMTAPLTGTPAVTMSGNYVPTYFLRGARAMANNRTAAKIDTTGSGDAFMNGVPGRPDGTISFSLVAGAKVTNKAGKLVTIESMLVGAANAGIACVFAFIDDTTDPLQPRDAMYAFVGNANKTRAMAAAVERAIDGYLAVPDDGSLPLVSIDFIA
jgi:hypothetical protein